MLKEEEDDEMIEGITPALYTTFGEDSDSVKAKITKDSETSATIDYYEEDEEDYL